MSASSEILNHIKDPSFRRALLESWVRSTLAHQIRGLRKKSEMDQEELARRLNTKQSAISRAESPEYGRMGMEFLFKLADAFDTALIIEFVSYEEFLRRRNSFSSRTLAIESFAESLPKLGHALEERPTEPKSTGSAYIMYAQASASDERHGPKFEAASNSKFKETSNGKEYEKGPVART